VYKKHITNHNYGIKKHRNLLRSNQLAIPLNTIASLAAALSALPKKAEPAPTGLGPSLVPTVPITPGIPQFIYLTTVTLDKIGMVGNRVSIAWWIGASHGIIIRIKTAVIEGRIVLGVYSILHCRFQVFRYIAMMHRILFLNALPSYFVKFFPKQRLVVKFIIGCGTTF
jgi:hypothetical protein